MNRETAKKLLPVIQAFAEGKEIEFEFEPGKWSNSITPCWQEDVEYRVKPEPREFWITVYADRPLGANVEHCGVYTINPNVEKHGRTTIRVREILDEKP